MEPLLPPPPNPTQGDHLDEIRAWSPLFKTPPRLGILPWSLPGLSLLDTPWAAASPQEHTATTLLSGSFGTQLVLLVLCSRIVYALGS